MASLTSLWWVCNESKSTWLPSFSIRNDIDIQDFSIAFKELAKLLVIQVEGKIHHKQRRTLWEFNKLILKIVFQWIMVVVPFKILYNLLASNTIQTALKMPQLSIWSTCYPEIEEAIMELTTSNSKLLLLSTHGVPNLRLLAILSSIPFYARTVKTLFRNHFLFLL